MSAGGNNSGEEGMKLAVKPDPTPLDEIDYLLELYDNADERAETVIDTWVKQYSAANPVVPTHRLTEIDAKSHGYSYPLALKRLRKLISEP
jgi:hypothetical protein